MTIFDFFNGDYEIQGNFVIAEYNYDTEKLVVLGNSYSELSNEDKFNKEIKYLYPKDNTLYIEVEEKEGNIV